MNDTLFKQKVRESGYRYQFLCEKLGITNQGFAKKRNGKIPFKVDEINTLTELLGLSANERDDIFGLISSR